MSTHPQLSLVRAFNTGTRTGLYELVHVVGMLRLLFGPPTIEDDAHLHL